MGAAGQATTASPSHAAPPLQPRTRLHRDASSLAQGRDGLAAALNLLRERHILDAQLLKVHDGQAVRQLLLGLQLRAESHKLRTGGRAGQQRCGVGA